MTLLFKNTYFEALEAALALVANDLNRLWESELCFADPDAMTVTLKNGHSCSPYEAQVCEIFRHHMSGWPTAPLIFEEDVFENGFTNTDNYLLVDPIDATHNLLCGYPAFATTCALIEDGSIIFGWVYDIPRSTEHIAARSIGAFRKTNMAWSRNRARPCLSLNSAWVATMGANSPNAETTVGRKFHKTRSQSCFALEGVLVAGGQLDGFIDLSAKKRHKVCDVAAAKIILEESGGVVLDGSSGRSLTDDTLTQDLNGKMNVVAAATNELGDALCKLI